MSNLRPNAETYRIRALAHLLSRDLEQARLEIRKALEMEPHNENILYTFAIIYYLSALATTALPAQIPQWPAPVEWTFVLRDNDSLSRLREAERVFQELAERPGRSNEDRQVLEAWRLACLTNDPDRQDEAVRYLQTILKAIPLHYRAIAWATSRNLSVTLTPSEKAIEGLIRAEKVEVFHVIALAGIYLSSGRARKALKLLDKTKSFFQKQQSDTLWRVWHVQALSASGNLKGAFKEIEEAASGGEIEWLHMRTYVLQAFAKKTGNWHEVIEHLEKSYQKTGDPKFLLESCQLMAQKGNWEYIADRAEVLIRQVSTGETLRLAAVASYNVKRFEVCLRLLDDHRSLFPNQKLTNELRRLRVLCTQAVGSLPEALAEQEALVRDENTTPNLLKLAQLNFEKGDLKGLVIISRELVNRKDLQQEHALEIAQLVQLEDQELAVSLWKKATSQGVADTLVAQACALGYHLGLDRELGPLTKRMQELGMEGQGGIHLATLKDLMEMMDLQRDRSRKLDELYRSGTVPIHFIAGQANRPLVDLYHRILSENEASPDPIKQFFLLVRHGGRSLTEGFSRKAPQWRLNLDLTAVLLAEHLDILDEVERAFAPLRIPSDVIPALIDMRDKISQVQPSRIRAFHQIIDLVESGAIQVEEPKQIQRYENTQLVDELGERWLAFFDNARASAGYLVDFLPLHRKDLSGPPSALPENADLYLVNCRSIVEALRQEGPLSEEEYAAALRDLGQEGQKTPSVTIPKEGKPLYCLANIPEMLANANILHIACERFKLHIEKAELEMARAELRQQNERVVIGDWITGLINRLRGGIDAGTYLLIPCSSEENSDTEEPKHDLSYRCLMSLLKFEPREDDVIWIDDRCLNSYLRRDSVHIVGVNEVLKALVSAGGMSETTFYDKVSQLRAANACFVPVQKNEILYHLRQARIENNALVETRELAILRKHIAACLLRGDVLQRPPLPAGSPNENGEIAFVIRIGREVTDALLDLWADEKSDEGTRQARAEWLLENLFLDHLGLTNSISMAKPEQDDRYLVALSLSGLISQAITLTPSRGEDSRSRRRTYFKWLFARILKKRFDADPALLIATVDNLKKLLLVTRDKTLDASRDEAIIILLQMLYVDLPEMIQTELQRDSEFMASMGFKSSPIVTIDGLEFNPDDFWRSASEAINGRESKLITLNHEKEVTFLPLEKNISQNGFYLIQPEIAEKKLIKRDELGLLRESPADREAMLRHNRHWFDCSGEALDRIIAEIVSMEDAARRIEAARLWQESSMAVYYRDKYDRLKKRDEFRFEDLLPPTAEGLLRHFKLTASMEPNEQFSDVLSSVAQALIRDEGLEVAIDRIVGFPVPLPLSLFDAVDRLSRDERRDLLKRLLRTASSPLAKVHLVHALVRYSDDTPAYGRLARRIAVHLLGDKASEEFEAFLTVLKWIHGEFDHFPDTRSWSPDVKLAIVWAHAHHIFTLFASLGSPTSWIHATFKHAPRRMPLELFERNPAYWFDVAHARHISREVFILSGLAYSFGEKAVKLIDKDLKKLLEKESFPEIADMHAMQEPALPLLKDFSLAYNSLSSFMGGDRGEALRYLLECEKAQTFGRASLRAMAARAIDMLLEEREQMVPWAILHAVISDFPPYEEIAERLKTLILQTDFVDLFMKDTDCGLLAIYLASLQLSNIDDEDTYRRLKDQIVKTASFLAIQNSQHTLDTIASRIHEMLLESALNVSIAAQRHGNVIPEVVDLFTRLIENWRSIVPTCWPIIQRLCQELPPSQTKLFVPLLLRLRALKA